MSLEVRQEDSEHKEDAGRPVNCSQSELSIFLQALEEGYLPTFYSDTSQSAQSKSMNIASKSFQRGKKTVRFHGFPSFQMSKSSTEDHGAALLTWYRGASLARTSASQETEQELTARGQDCGEKWRESSARYDLDSHSWKTHQCLWEEALPWSSVTLPNWGMTRNGFVYQHSTSERPIQGIASGFLLPTPSGVNRGSSHVMGRLDELGGSGNIWRGTEIGKVRCASFEEWMMGWPTGWSALTPLETGRFQQWQQQHSPFLQEN